MIYQQTFYKSLGNCIFKNLRLKPRNPKVPPLFRKYVEILPGNIGTFGFWNETVVFRLWNYNNSKLKPRENIRSEKKNNENF